MLQKIDDIEHIAIGLVARLLPWLAPIPSAYLIGRTLILHFQYSVIMGLIVAIIIEALGLAATSTVLEVFIFNQNRRKIDPPAPIGLPIFLVILYLILTTTLTVIIEIYPSLAVFTPTIYPSISLAGFGILGLQNYLTHRRKILSEEKAERKAERQANRLEKSNGVTGSDNPNMSTIPSNNGNMDTISVQLQSGRRAKMDARIDALLEFLRQNPGIEIAEAARQLNLSRQTVYSYLKQLQQAGHINRNGKNIEVIG